MKKQKVYYIAALPIIVLGLFWLITQAFHFISAPSDSSVVIGVLLLSLAFLIIISIIVFLRKKL